MILVSLVLSGKVPAIPKYASNAVTRNVKSHASEYEALATCCQVRAITRICHRMAGGVLRVSAKEWRHIVNGSGGHPHG